MDCPAFTEHLKRATEAASGARVSRTKPRAPGENKPPFN
jgi:hypothetical protein